MKAVPVQAHQIASLSGARSSDGQFGLVRFVRKVPMPDGQTDVWMAVPTKLLPYLATVAIQALPQPQGTTVPSVLNARRVALGSGPNGEILLTVTLAKGATLSYLLEPGQAEGLLAGLQKAVGGAKNGAAQKTTTGKTAKPRA
jgi:hypothetical protein